MRIVNAGEGRAVRFVLGAAEVVAVGCGWDRLKALGMGTKSSEAGEFIFCETFRKRLVSQHFVKK